MNEIHVFARDPPWESTPSIFFRRSRWTARATRRTRWMNRPASLEHIAREPQRLEPPAGATERVFLGKTNGKIRFLWIFLDVQWGLNQQECFFLVFGKPLQWKWEFSGLLPTTKGLNQQKWCIEPGNIRVLSCKNGEKTPAIKLGNGNQISCARFDSTDESLRDHKENIWGHHFRQGRSQTPSFLDGASSEVDRPYHFSCPTRIYQPLVTTIKILGWHCQQEILRINIYLNRSLLSACWSIHHPASTERQVRLGSTPLKKGDNLSLRLFHFGRSRGRRCKKLWARSWRVKCYWAQKLHDLDWWLKFKKKTCAWC